MGGAQRPAAGPGRWLTVAAVVLAAAALAGCGVPVVGATTSPARPAAR
jgi:hypothetical protein